ncbi:hypothetical protein SLS55_010415 [Diplodia seriata]|uniref:Uncharacterized protein n=1 Tax=Diplodia seriata TaxID=420778 RepID=A0ABR3BYH0_9PEZI
MAAVDTTLANDASLTTAAQALYNLICGHINEPTLSLPGVGSRAATKDALKDALRRVHHFGQDNREGTIEMWTIFWGYRSDGQLQWTLKIVWGKCDLATSSLRVADRPRLGKYLTHADAENPVVASPQTPHYGYEMYLNNRRVAGPGHVWFGQHLTHYRVAGLGVNEEEIGVNLKQFSVGTGRIDQAVRLFKLGRPGGADARDGEFAPQALVNYARPSFGRA